MNKGASERDAAEQMGFSAASLRNWADELAHAGNGVHREGVGL